MKYDFDAIHDRKSTESLKWRYPEWVLKEKDVIPMWVADMDFESPPEVKKAIIERAEHGIFGYPIIPKSFWQAVIDWLKKRHNWEVQKSWMATSPGIVPALHLCVRAFTAPRDEVIIQTPVYHPFFQAIEKNDRIIIKNSLVYDSNTWIMDFDSLKRLITPKTKLLILCSPHNPVGRVWKKEELEKLSQIVQAYDLLVISDEIHHDFVFPGHKHIPLASISGEIARRTITLVAPNKTFNLAGLNTGVVIASNHELLKKFETEAEKTGLDQINIFGLTALETAYNYGAQWVDELVAYIEENCQIVRQFFPEQIPEIKFLVPEGTYLGLLDCRSLKLPQKELDEFFLKKARVQFEPGLKYGQELEGFERINLACPKAILRQALDRIARAVTGFLKNRRK